MLKRTASFWIVTALVAVVVVAGGAARVAGFRLVHSEADVVCVGALYALALMVGVNALFRFKGPAPWLALSLAFLCGGYLFIEEAREILFFGRPDTIVTERSVDTRRYEVWQHDIASVFDHVTAYQLVVRDVRFPAVERRLGWYYTDEHTYGDPVPHRFQWHLDEGRVEVTITHHDKRVGELPRR